MNEKVKDILEWILCIVIALVLALLIRYYIGTPTIVKQVSMKPTLLQDDRLILNRWGRTTKKLPERGDIITFEAPTNARWSKDKQDLTNPIAKYENKPTNVWEGFVHNVLEWGKESYIKRVIALPGEHVQIKNGKVYINDKELEEKYEQEKTASENVTESVATDITDEISADSENTPDITDEPDLEQTAGIKM